MNLKIIFQQWVDDDYSGELNRMEQKYNQLFEAFEAGTKVTGDTPVSGAYRVCAIGWHCFSLHCKHSIEYECNKESNKTGFCRQNDCPIFINAKDVKGTLSVFRPATLAAIEKNKNFRRSCNILSTSTRQAHETHPRIAN